MHAYPPTYKLFLGLEERKKEMMVVSEAHSHKRKDCVKKCAAHVWTENGPTSRFLMRKLEIKIKDTNGEFEI